MNRSFIALNLLSFAIALASTGWLKRLFQTALVDIPNDRSSHTRPTPRGGGLGFLIAFLVVGWGSVGLRLLGWFDPGELLPPLGLVTVVIVPLAAIGLVDDRRDVPAALRYLVQLGVAAITLWGSGLVALPWFAQNLSIAAIAAGAVLIGFTALVNFYNFMDGLDGLVAGVTTVQLAFLAIYLQQPLWWLLAAAMLGFLWWNWSPAKIFMGDVGSTVLGASIAISLIMPTVDPGHQLAAIAITLPLTADATYTLFRRLLRRENIFKAHRTHLYQRLQQSGWSHRKVAVVYILWTLFITALVGQLHLLGGGISLFLSGLLIGLGEYYLKTQKVLVGQD